MEINESVRIFLETGEDWERRGTSVKGVSLIRLPKTKNRPASLAVDINPVNEKGLPLKKKGIMLMNTREFMAFKEIFNNEKVIGLLAAVEEVIPDRKGPRAESPDVLQI